MKTQNAIAKLHRAGFQITLEPDSASRFVATNASPHLIEFLSQGNEVTLIRVRRKNDRDDSMTDYSAGVFVPNITRAIAIAR
jgi:hypothetical protein